MAAWAHINVQAARDYMKEKLLAAIRLCVPKPKKRTRRGVEIPWWNKEFKQKVKRKHKAWKDCTRTRGADEYKAYVQQRNITTQRMKMAFIESGHLT